MKVELIGRTEDAVRVASIGASTCVSKEIPNTPTIAGLRNAIASGHESVLEHAVYTFAISGISRACSHQLVRHRMASFSQQSQRYVKMDDADYITPSSIEKKGDALILYDLTMLSIWHTYEQMLKAGIPEEDARYILPNATCTNIVVTMNARELRHFFKNRLCGRAQWEIRELARRMYLLVIDIDPELFEGCGPACISDGRCHEKKPCGQSPDEVMAWMEEDE